MTYLPRKAFTLLELIMVMLVITIALSVAAPNLRGFLGGSKTKNCAMQIVALTRWARTQAISEGRTYRVAFDGKNVMAAYQDQTQTPAQFVPVTADLGETIVVPDNVDLSVQRTDGGANDHLDFFADGHCEIGLISLREQSTGNQIRVVCDSPTEQYRLAKSGEVVQ